MSRKQFTIMQRLKSLSGQHAALDTVSSDKTFRFNSRTYTIAASIIGLQTKPRAGVNMTNDIIGMESSPGINSGFTSTQGIVCYKAEPNIGSTAGAITGDVRSYEASLGKPSGAGTISGVMSALKCINNANGTITGGVHALDIPNHGDTLAWTSLIRFRAALGTHSMTSASDKTGNAKDGTIKVDINGTIKHIQLYAD